MKIKKRIPLLFIGIFFLIVIFFVFDLKKYLNLEFIKNWINDWGVFAPLAFMIIYFLAVLFFVSAAGLSVGAGILFGNLYGTIYTVIAATLAAQAAFYLARFFGRDLIDSLPKSDWGRRIKQVDKRVGQNSFKHLFILRALFLPYIPLSYAAGLGKKVNPWGFLGATFLSNAIFTPAFVFLGDSLLKGPKALILPGSLIFLVLLIPKLIKRFRG
ncbi:MAG: hypothetical protein GF335_01635 [Candidatus Moranbacteria bacterium]|nr:hypothetical protein [Candidatus Moranbacteria bacterium]